MVSASVLNIAQIVERAGYNSVVNTCIACMPFYAYILYVYRYKTDGGSVIDL